MDNILTLSAKHIMQLYGLSESGARYKMKSLRERFAKEPKQPVTILDVSQDLGIQELELQKRLV